MRFAEPTYFALLIGVVMLGLFVFWAIGRKKRLLNLFGDLPLLLKNAPYISFARQRTKAILVLAGLALVCVAMARLQFGTHMEKLEREDPLRPACAPGRTRAPTAARGTRA